MGKGEAWKVQKWKEGNIAKYNRVRSEERCGEIRSRTRSRVELTGWRKWHLGEGFLCKPGPHALCFHPTCEVKWTVQSVLHNTNQSTNARVIQQCRFESVHWRVRCCLEIYVLSYRIHRIVNFKYSIYDHCKYGAWMLSVLHDDHKWKHSPAISSHLSSTNTHTNIAHTAQWHWASFTNMCINVLSLQCAQWPPSWICYWTRIISNWPTVCNQGNETFRTF